VAGSAAVVAWYAVAGVAATSASSEPSEPPTAIGEDGLAQPPVELTGCDAPGPEVRGGTDEETVVATPVGEMTIAQRRGYTWRLQVSSVSDPRLEGTHYHSWAGDA
jgi:hypothetical protein